MSDNLNKFEKESSNAGSSYQFKERLNNIEKSKCNKCNKYNTIETYSCSHKLCYNCIFKYFISNNFKGMSTLSIKLICPKCEKGEKDINLDDFIKKLDSLLYDKNGKNDDNNLDDSNILKNCNTHKDRKVIKYCNQCCIEMCEKCLREIHNRNFPYHTLVDINEKNSNINNKNKNIPSLENIKDNKEINELQEKELIFLQKIENERILIGTKIKQLTRDIESFYENYNKKINDFQNSMKKIFQIINLTYYNYYISSLKDQKEISKKNLNDFNIILKKFDFSEINFSLQKLNKDFNIEKPIFNYELQWEDEEYKPVYILKPKGDDKEKADCVTKIIEIKNTNKIVASLISGQILVWDLSSQNIDYTIDAHKSAIWSMIQLLNHNIVTGSSDKMIKLWDIANGMDSPILTLKGHKGTIFCLGEIEKNKLLSGSEDRTIKLWDIFNKEKKCILTLNDPNESKINCLYILPDPGFIVTGGDDNLLKIWNIYSNYIPNTLEGHECTIWAITSISDDDTIIASGSSDNTIKIWDLISLKCLYTLEGHENTISSLKILNNGLLVSTSWDKFLKIWNLKTRKCIVTLKGHNNIIWDVIQLNNGDLASCSSDKKIIVWSKNK